MRQHLLIRSKIHANAKPAASSAAGQNVNINRVYQGLLTRNSRKFRTQNIIFLKFSPTLSKTNLFFYKLALWDGLQPPIRAPGTAMGRPAAAHTRCFTCLSLRLSSRSRALAPKNRHQVQMVKLIPSRMEYRVQFRPKTRVNSTRPTHENRHILWDSKGQRSLAGCGAEPHTQDHPKAPQKSSNSWHQDRWRGQISIQSVIIGIHAD